MHVHVPAAGSYGIVETALLADVLVAEDVDAIDTSCFADADIRPAADEVRILEAGHVFLPAFEHYPGVAAALHLGAGKIGRDAGVGRHAHRVDIRLIRCEHEGQP